MVKSAISFSILALFCMVNLGCPGSSSSSTTSPSSGGGGGSGPFTAAEISETWNGQCTAASEPVTGATYVEQSLTLDSNNTFSYTEYWYSAPGCAPANYVSVYFVAGAYSVGGYVSGSSGPQGISFTVGSAHVETMTQTAMTGYNNDCGGTSPYCALSMSTCSTPNGTVGEKGVAYSTLSFNCMSEGFPSSAGAKNTVNNIATYDGTSLTMGAFQVGVPGVFSDGTTSSTVTLQLQ